MTECQDVDGGASSNNAGHGDDWGCDGGCAIGAADTGGHDAGACCLSGCDNSVCFYSARGRDD